MPPKNKSAAGAGAPDDSAAPGTPKASQEAQSAVEGPDAAPVGSQDVRLEIRCARATGIWRAGRFWPPELVTVSADQFSADQIAALKAEPLLSVQIQE